MLGLDVVTPESLYGYESDNAPPLMSSSSGIEQSYTTEKIILPDTSQFLQQDNNVYVQKSIGPLVTFPKYNNYLLDKTKFDQNTHIFVPLKLLGIKPVESGELLTKHTLSDSGAVLSYAQYKQTGSLLPENYDESVVRRWGVDIIIGSPLISVSILVPEYVEAISNNNNNAMNENNIIFQNINLPSSSDNDDKDKWIKKVLTEPINKIHENEPQYYQFDDVGHRRKRDDDSLTKKLLYKSLSGVILPLPIRLQIWLDPNITIFNERSNPQCVHWSTARGYILIIILIY